MPDEKDQDRNILNELYSQIGELKFLLHEAQVTIDELIAENTKLKTQSSQ